MTLTVLAIFMDVRSARLEGAYCPTQIAPGIQYPKPTISGRSRCHVAACSTYMRHRDYRVAWCYLQALSNLRKLATL
ncbi:hypothetical protein OE88DRAFT_1343775 [Heliocybe sulcata]|uniref:Uncharacterized protein n=1 Tax=Heliocybe sulcata TaxID=5364 RepID=A0A5C3N752_9AGAM|nr:hypothetical protein OE88DRAFT_1343775 [Heliocybe sulcata]